MKRRFLEFADFLHEQLRPEGRSFEREAIERQPATITNGVGIGTLLYVTSSLLNSALYSVVAFLGILALSWWGEPRPAAIASWAATAFGVLAILVYAVAGLLLLLVLALTALL